SDYEKDVASVLGQLSAANIDTAVELLSLPDRIRGYGPVKEKAAKDAKARHEQLVADLANPPPAPRQMAAEQERRLRRVGTLRFSHLKTAVIPGRAEGAGPESILPIVVMDSGLAACASPRNDERARSTRRRAISTYTPCANCLSCQSAACAF